VFYLAVMTPVAVGPAAYSEGGCWWRCRSPC